MSGAKSWDLKLWTYALWTSHKEHTKSAIRKAHLAPCRFNCWTNQISIGISQPLAQLQRRYNVEIPRVSLPNVRAKWDFTTDSMKTCILLAYFAYFLHIFLHILHIDFHCILCIFYILVYIFCILFHILFDIFCILISIAYFAYCTY